MPFLPYPDPRFGLQIWLAERATRTDAQGRFALAGLPRSGVHFEFRRGDGRSVLPYQSLKLGGAENEVKMKSAGMIRGRVVDRDGKPVRNFRILVNAPHERQVGEKFGSYFAGYCGIGITFTSDDGSFVITGLGEPGGLCRISAVAEGHAEGAVDRVISTTLGHLPPADAVDDPAGAAQPPEGPGDASRRRGPTGRRRGSRSSTAIPSSIASFPGAITTRRGRT